MQLLYCEILEKGFSLSRSPIYPGIPFLKLPTETTTHTQSWEGDPAIAVSYRLAEKSYHLLKKLKTWVLFLSRVNRLNTWRGCP